MQELSERLLAAGYALTPQRRRIAETLVRAGKALTARQLSEQLQNEGQPVGVMTVYRTLQILAAIGAVYALYDPQGEAGEAHYVFCTDRHHHHLVCSNCWGVWEVDGCSVSEELEAQVARRTGFRVTGHRLDFHGLCATCQATASS